MVPGQLIEATTAAAIARGIHPIDITEAITEIIIEETLGLPDHDPRAVLLARRLIGTILDAGWTMPGQGDEP